jgi:hypothetical protein
MAKKPITKPTTPEKVAETALAESSSLQRTSDKLAIVTRGDYQRSALFLSELKTKRDQIETKRKEITKPIDEAKKRIMALFKPVVDQLSLAITTVDRKMIDYVSAEEEKARKEAEAQAKKLLKKTGNRELAEDVKALAIEQATPQASGVQVLSYWHAEVTNLDALVSAVSQSIVPTECVQPNEVYLNKLARLHQDPAKAPPGVKFVEVRKTGRVGGGGNVL